MEYNNLASFFYIYRQRFASGNIFRLPYESELSTAYAQMCTRIRVRGTRACSTPMSSSHKSKRDAQGVSFTFWWNRRRFACGNIFRWPYESELSTAYAQMCTRIRHKVPSEFNSQVKFLKKKKGVRKALLFSFWWNRRELNPCPKTS